MSYQKDNVQQGGRITRNLGNRFPRNLKVPHEILIVNPAHLTRKYDAPKTTKLPKKKILSHKKTSTNLCRRLRRTKSYSILLVLFESCVSFGFIGHVL